MESVNYLALAFWLTVIGLPMLLLRRHIFVILAPPIIVLVVYIVLHTVFHSVRP
jgi:hypothetical protein